VLPLNGSGGKTFEVGYGLWGMQAEKVDLYGSMIGMQSCY
jgi:hypothetical protein